ncbi:metallophosphoesterase family protein [Pseudomonas syringae]|uniref:metallophosphoesterase family protein n=1 Tax=Pseudomonas syringae TaxID=317 RepID=UPI003F74E900
MSSTVSWLHLSDFHTGKDGYEESEMFSRIIHHVRKKMAAGFVPDFVFITGDIADKGASDQYEKFCDNFLQPLQETIGGDIHCRTYMVPGNHDLDRRINHAFDRVEFGKLRERYFDPTPDGARARKMLVERFASFIANDVTDRAKGFADHQGAFAERVTVRDTEVGIVGVNTAWLSRDENDEGFLTIGKPLLETALREVEGSELTIVLGHHPISWFAKEQQRPIRSLLAHQSCIYLHGHLHDAWSEPSYGDGDFFLAIQSGAAFQAREGDRWRNGLVWGRADLRSGMVGLQSYHWNANHQNWTMNTDPFSDSHRDGDWWNYRLPSTLKPAYAAKTPEAGHQLPGGWEIVRGVDLEPHLGALESASALAFFDGAVPDWSTALSRSIPRREIVGRLVAPFKAPANNDMCTVTLLTAAGCEGKTTALLQAAFEIIKDNPEWSILRRKNDLRPFDIIELTPFLLAEGKWLVVLDGADQIARAVHAFASSDVELATGKVSFLLGSRDSDWLACGADKLAWKAVCNFKHEQLSGLSLDDAAKIVDAWSVYGDVGLGELANTEANFRATRFRDLAKLEAKSSSAGDSGAFFGALLGVRHGSDLIDHARAMLDKLETISIPSGGTLKDAMAFISIMHAEGQDYLSIPVLAGALGCDIGKFHALVIRPLGQEAAATTTSTCVYTRHKNIAKAIVNVLENGYLENIAEHFKSLVKAALAAYRDGGFIKGLHSWRYDLAEHFYTSNRPLLAVEIAQAVFEADPNEPRVITNLAYLNRVSKEPQNAVRIYRDAQLVTENRPYYNDWAVSESECRNFLEGTVLAAYALSDQCASSRPSVDDVKGYLSTIGKGFKQLYNAYLDSSYRDADHAVMSIRLIYAPQRLNSEFREFRSRVEKRRANEYELNKAIQILGIGIRSALEGGVHSSVLDGVLARGNFTFSGLETLSRNKSEA